MELHSTRLKSRNHASLLTAAAFALLCLAGLPASAQTTTLLSQGFEGSTFPPTGWQRATITGSPSYTWQRYGSSSSTRPTYVSAHGGTHYAAVYQISNPSGSAVALSTPILNFSSSSAVELSFWFYRSNYSSSYSNKLEVYVNTSRNPSGGTMLDQIHHYYTQSPAVSSAGWYKYTYRIPPSYNGTTNYIIFKDDAYGASPFLDDVAVLGLPPCSGMPTAGTLNQTGTKTVCPGSTVDLVVSGYTKAGVTSMGWEYSTNGGTSWNFVPGANTDKYTTFPITRSTKFRFWISCDNTGDTARTLATTFNLTGGGGFPQYASLPFFEDFESWTSGCGNKDLPSTNWTSQPSTGNSSWRRDDKGSTASWSSPSNGDYSSPYVSGSHSARFHAYYATGRAKEGSLSLYLNCATAPPGNKELEFYSLLGIGSSATYPNDSLYVEYSTNAGMTWNLLARYGSPGGTGKWDYHSGLVLPSNSPTTIVRFTGSQNYGSSYNAADIHIDAVRVFPPCSGLPVAGTIDSVEPCAGKDFTLQLKGTSANAGLTYQWQYRVTGGASPVWTNLTGGNIPRPTANITVPTSFRAIVTCTGSGQSDTSKVLNVPIAPFYYCYCDVGKRAQYPYQYGGIGNVSVETKSTGTVLMSHGNPLPVTNNPTATAGYKSFARTVTPPVLIRDSTYHFSITVATPYGSLISGSNTFAHIYLDVNRDGVWNLPGEKILSKSWSTSGQTVSADYTIPSNAPTGLTGMRAIAGYYPMRSSTGSVHLDPCGDFYYQSSAEDYLAYIQYKPCDGPVSAGTSYATDTAVCPNYTVDLWNTTYTQDRTDIGRDWQISANTGASYLTIPNSHNKDTLRNVVVPSSPVYGIKYRLRTVCMRTGDTTYSTAVLITNPPASSCYPFAAAMPPGTNDSSDIGSFMIGPVDSPHIIPAPVQVVGPHLLNPSAVRGFTNYTHISPIWVLAADSVYRLGVYHIMRSATHADALVSVYIDFNHDHYYTEATPGAPYPSELVYRGQTTATNFFLDTTFKMPSQLIPNVPTGVRVILNNDLNPNNPGNTGRGGFVSGEVEDYTVILNRVNVGVNGPAALMKNLVLFPNPTTHKATLIFDATRTISRLELTVTTISGQRVMSRSFSDVDQHFQTDIDLAGQAKGIYFVEMKTDDGQKIVSKLVLQ
jgi:hypothetical protein